MPETVTSPIQGIELNSDTLREGVRVSMTTSGGIPVEHLIGLDGTDLTHMVITTLGDGLGYLFERRYLPFDGLEGDYSVVTNWIGFPDGCFPCEIYEVYVAQVASEGHFEPIPALQNMAMGITAVNQGF